MDVITSHLNADFDSLASAIAAKKLYPEAVIVFPGSLEKKVRDFIDAFSPVEITKYKDISPERVERLIIVDTKHPDRIGPLKELLSMPGVKIHVYDHHPATKDDIKGELEMIDGVGAESTIFAELLQKKKILISPLEATILCLGIYEETGSLLFTSTTPRDLTAVAYLLKRGANLNIVSDFLKEELSREELSLLNELIASLREIVVQGIRIKLAKGTMEGFGDVSHLAHQIMEMGETDAAFLLVGMADKILIVARSRVSELDVSQALSVFGGGGHPTASSATIKDVPFEIVEERLVAAVNKFIRPVKVAGDVMTKPVITIDRKSSIREAEKMMTRYGINVLPVVGNSGYAGILTREVVEKAIFHGLGKNRCEDFASTDAITVTQEMPVADLEKTMIEQNQRFVAVLKDNSIIGAITRTDILRSLYEDFLRKSRISSKGPSAESTGLSRNIANLLKERLPDHLLCFLDMAGETADKTGIGIYLVGGCVRDLLRNEENLDIDIVVEGDGIAFAKRLGRKTGAKITVHEKFGTAQVIIRKTEDRGQSADAEAADGASPSRMPCRASQQLKIDVATSRTEYYESPAALPTIETSSIKKDLYRRDFTINTLAVKINKKDFGLLIDFFGGQRDLKEKAIRVLHNLSFVEDPTRAFRAIRFSERFGFRITRHTENLIKLAVRMNIFEKLAGTRIYDELILTFRETNPVKALKRFGDYGLLKVIHPDIIFSPELESLLQSVHDTISWFGLSFLDEPCDRGVIYITALLHKLDRADVEAALKRLSVPARLEDRIMKGIHTAPDILKKLKPDSPVETYHLLMGMETEFILFAMALARDNEKKKAISHFLLEQRNIKPLIKGSDLKALGLPPGPVYSDMLGKVLDKKLAGKLKTKEEELEFVKKHFV